MDLDPSYKDLEKFRGSVQWYMLQTKDFVSNIGSKSKNEKGKLVSFNGQSINLRLSIKENEIVFQSKSMLKTLIKTRIRFNKPKSKPKQDITTSPLLPNLQFFQQQLISGNGYRVYNSSVIS